MTIGRSSGVRRSPWFLICVFISACGPGTADRPQDGGSGIAPGSGGVEGTTGDDDSDPSSSSGEPGSEGPDGAEPPCPEPELMLLVDRSNSMRRRPDGTKPNNDMAGYVQSRWWLAIEAVEDFSFGFQADLEIGLTLFPGGDPECLTMPELLGGAESDHDGCGTSETVLAPAAMSADELSTALDPLNTPLCTQTPITTGLAEVAAVLAESWNEDSAQFVVLVTDGGESCGGDVTAAVNALALEQDIRTYVVAFGESAVTESHAVLNHAACAGQTAPGFPAPCEDDGAGGYLARDPEGPALYITAEDGAALDAAFDGIGEDVICPEG